MGPETGSDQPFADPIDFRSSGVDPEAPPPHTHTHNRLKMERLIEQILALRAINNRWRILRDQFLINETLIEVVKHTGRQPNR